MKLAQGKRIKASNVRGNSSDYSAENVNDGNSETYWATDDTVNSAQLTIEFDVPTEVKQVVAARIYSYGATG